MRSWLIALVALGIAMPSAALAIHKEELADCANDLARARFLETLSMQHRSHPGPLVLARSLRKKLPAETPGNRAWIKQLDAILEQREDDIQFVLPGYSIFLDDSPDVDRVEAAADLGIGNYFETV